ncbi:MAG TPA: carboxypeptidase regulatory-like domain-containing protein [Verrucomicrobiae bacterium]|nr:carboxypeptidase regulatory-like domain-containing protein [Verrucomicrobiae bacterium]
MLRLNSGTGLRLRRLVLVPVLAFLASAVAWAQAPAGRITGTVTDSAGVPVPGARVTVSNPVAQVGKTTTDAKGAYSVGGLSPGTYTVRIEARDFETNQFPVEVKEEAPTEANVKLVIAREIQVNLEQATAQGTLNREQISSLFLDGRNFLEVAQLEPGVQLQDGENIDPTKAGSVAVSIGNRFGRDTRFSVDGADVTDEISGSAAEDIPIGGIQSFSVERSTFNVTTDLTGSGAVSVITKRGGDSVHGDLFGFFRDSKIAGAKQLQPFDSSTNSFIATPYQRNDFGGSLGAPMVKGKAYFFVAGERAFEHSSTPVSELSPYDQFSGAYNSPFEDDDVQARADYSVSKTSHVFGRVNYFRNIGESAFFPSSFQVFTNHDFARNAVVGTSFNAANITHSITFSYLRLQSGVLDATRGTSLPFANYPVSINVGTFTVGPNSLAPQASLQSDRQIRYDGTKNMGRHLLHFGFGYNRIQAGGSAALFQTDPQVFGTAPGADPDPTTLSLTRAQVMVGNGLGYSSPQSAFGYPAGGLGPDNRITLYIGDTWKAKPNLTITPGLRWERDTNRTDSDLPAIPELNNAFPGWGHVIQQPNKDFAPQLGIAWDPRGTGKTVLRVGAGVYYEDVLYNDLRYDRATRERNGTYLSTPTACAFGNALPIPTENAGLVTVDSVEGLDPATGHSYCADSIGQAAPALAAFQTAYQADSPFSSSAPNPEFVGSRLLSGLNVAGGLISPNYRTPRTIQMNAGFEHEIRPGTILSADYVRSIETHTLLGVDINHSGAARFLNVASALSAVNLTVADCGAPSLALAIAPQGCPGIHPASATSGAGAATVSDFVARGLGSPADTGSSCLTAADPSTGFALGFPCAFGGINPNYGVMNVLEPVGRSLYRGVQVKLVQSMPNPFHGVKAANLQIAYAYSRLSSPLGFQGNAPSSNPVASNDLSSVLRASDNDNPLRFNGPSLLDRTHQISFGGLFDAPRGFRVGVTGHFDSPLSSPAIVGSTGSGGQIFQTDFTGSGVGSQPLNGTANGSYMRSLDLYSLNSAISRYNLTDAGQATPAGQALVGSNVFTVAQLQTIGAVAPVLPAAPIDQLVFPWVKSLDMRLSWSHTFRDRFTVEPSVGVFNIFNIANFNLPPGAMSGWLDEGVGGINSTHTDVQPGQTSVQSNTFRTNHGTGTFDLAGPRVIEWSMQIKF